MIHSNEFWFEELLEDILFKYKRSFKGTDGDWNKAVKKLLKSIPQFQKSTKGLFSIFLNQKNFPN